MADPESELVDEIEDAEEAEIEFTQQSTFDVPPFDQDGNPIWEQF